MRNFIGGTLLAVGMIAMFIIWMFTTYVFFATGQTGLALTSLLIPPADLVLPFLISPMLGFIGLGSLAAGFAGAALRGD